MDRIGRLFVGLVTTAIVIVGALPAAADPSPDVLRVTPPTVSFGAKPVGSMTFKSTTITNTSSETIDLVVIVTREWDDFSFGLLPGSTCPGFDPAPLDPGESCVLIVGFAPSETFLRLTQDQRFRATASDPATGEILDIEEFVFLGKAR